MTWIKYRAKYAHGKGKWEYDDLGDEGIEDFIHDLAFKYDTAMHFRGIEFEMVDVPPVDELLALIQSVDTRVELLKARSAELKALFNKYYAEV